MFQMETALEAAYKGLHTGSYQGTWPPDDLEAIVPYWEKHDVSRDNVVFLTVAHGGADSIETSNFRSLARDFGKHPDVVCFEDRMAVVVRGECDDQEIVRVIHRLNGYPLYDDDDHSNLLMEWQDEAHEEMVADLARALRRRFERSDIEGWEEAVDLLHDAGALSYQLSATADLAHVEWVEENGAAWLNARILAVRAAPLAFLNAPPSYSGWLTSGQQFLRSRLADVLISGTVRFPLLPQLRALIDALWMFGGVQPPSVLGPFDEEAARRQLEEVEVPLRAALRLCDKISSDPTLEAEYLALAEAFAQLDPIITTIEASRGEPEEDQARIVIELAPMAVQVMATIDAMRPKDE